MPYITAEVDVDIDDVLTDCSTRELKEAAQYIVREAAENDSIKEALVDEMLKHSDSFGRDIVRNFGKPDSSYSPMEQEHIAKMELLASKFYAMSNEDISALEEIYSKYK
jgi:hypothetical protein